MNCITTYFSTLDKKVFPSVSKICGDRSIQTPSEETCSSTHQDQEHQPKQDDNNSRVIEINNPPDSNFPSFDDFVDGLMTWRPILQKTWSLPFFRRLYIFLKQEYNDPKKVVFPYP